MPEVDQRKTGEAIRKQLYSLANLPPIYWDLCSTDLANLRPEHKQAIENWFDTFIQNGRPNCGQPGWYIYGGLGSGKTTMACIMAKYICTLPHELGNDIHSKPWYRDRLSTPYVAFHIWPTVLDIMLGHRGDARRSALYQDLEHADLLVIDNLGVEHMAASGWESAQLEMILRERAYAGHSTIITSNVDLLDVAERYGKPVLSLLKAYYNCVLVTGEDYRSTTMSQLRLKPDDE